MRCFLHSKPEYDPKMRTRVRMMSCPGQDYITEDRDEDNDRRKMLFGACTKMTVCDEVVDMDVLETELVEKHEDEDNSEDKDEEVHGDKYED